MSEVTVILSKEAIPRNFDQGTDYWVATDLLEPAAIAGLRETGIAITVLSTSPVDDDRILEVIRMAMLHNADWSRLSVLR